MVMECLVVQIHVNEATCSWPLISYFRSKSIQNIVQRYVIYSQNSTRVVSNSEVSVIFEDLAVYSSICRTMLMQISAVQAPLTTTILPKMPSLLPNLRLKMLTIEMKLCLITARLNQSLVVVSQVYFADFFHRCLHAFRFASVLDVFSFVCLCPPRNVVMFSFLSFFFCIGSRCWERTCTCRAFFLYTYLHTHIYILYKLSVCRDQIQNPLDHLVVCAHMID